MADLMAPAEILRWELVQRAESGFDVSGVEDDVRAALDEGSPVGIEGAHTLLEESNLRSGWRYEEPSTFEAIRATFPPSREPLQPILGDRAFLDRLLGAWLGRCAGCSLGKPVEGWTRERINRYLDLAGAYPIDDYLPALDPAPADLQLNPCWAETTRGNVASMARDDDIDYTILALHLLEEHGFGFSTADVAFEWLDHLPYNQVYTAERAAYRNLVDGVGPPETAWRRNPYREWIGAQIRADLWGYVCPGNPARASELAFRDASLSHTANGIYGEMWIAALIAAAFGTQDVREALGISLEYVPPRSRLVEAIRDVLAMHAGRLSWNDARDGIGARYGHYSGVHTVNNAAVVVAALLWGDGDYSRTIGLAVEGGWDTDCNGATAGSVFGAMHGATALPAHWVDPLHDLVRTAILGYDGSSITDLARRTFRLGQG